MKTEPFQKLLLTQQSFLTQWASYLTQNRTEIADLCQETNLRALKNADKFVEGSNIGAWLQTLMRHIYYNEYERLKHFQKITHEIAQNQKSGSFTNDKNNAEETLNTSDEKQKINKAFRSLPSELRIPFVLYFNGHAYREISRLIRKPMGTVKNRIFKARKSLSILLSKKEKPHQ